jgi:phosphoadenosine phosphosulfate reductase
MNLVEKIEHSKEVIKKALKEHNKIRLACSWGKDSMVVLHLALQVDKNIDVFAVLTPYKPIETFQYMDRMKREWKLNLTEYTSDKIVPYELYKTNPDECCRILKVLPTKEALKGYDAWITGLRNDEGETRRGYKEVEEHGSITKINPILNWSEREIWQYIAVNNIPVHPWYKLGYRSLGCSPCTVIIDDEEPERNGRWQGTKKQAGECGIHNKKAWEKM